MEAIAPYDELEAQHRSQVLAWINSGTGLCRVAKPDKPAMHLVSYFAVCDMTAKQVLLVNHRKAGLWLPSGGHVYVGEYPADTVRREAVEELELIAAFTPELGERPVFVTATVTVGHTDVSLWYVVAGKAGTMYTFDAAEFSEIRWFGFQEVLSRPITEFDPHLHRFINKLQSLTLGA